MSEMQIVDQSLGSDEPKNDGVVIIDNPDDELKTEDNHELKELLRENLELTKEIRSMVNHINRYVAWQRIFGILKVLIILIPIILGVIYLPPLLKEPYKQLLSIVQSNIDQIDQISN